MNKKEVVLIPDLSGLINFGNNYKFDSVNMQAAHLIQMKLDIFKCLLSDDTPNSEILNYDDISKELFGAEGTQLLFIGCFCLTTLVVE